MHMAQQLALGAGIGSCLCLQAVELLPLDHPGLGHHKQAALAASQDQAAGGVLPLLWHLHATGLFRAAFHLAQ